MATPTIVPTQYDKTSNDYLKVKMDRSGATRIDRGQVSIPAATAAATLVGLVPFNIGATFHMDSFSVYVDDLDTGSTVAATLGWTYDDTVNNTPNLSGFGSSATTPQSGGFMAVNASTAPTFVATGNGWVVLQISAGPTTTTGNASFNILTAYDGRGVNNQNSQA